MYDPLSLTFVRKPAILFCIGWAIVMLSLTVSIPPVWNTFIHSWRVEFFASLFIAGTALYSYFTYSKTGDQLAISNDELKFILLPIALFIGWSALSALWAPSWRSAIHHALVWSEYLVFYVAVRQVLSGQGNYAKLVTTLVGILCFFAILAAFGYCDYLYFGGGTSIGIVYAKWGEQVNTVFPLVMVGVLRLGGRRFLLGLGALVCVWLLVFCSLSRVNLVLFVAGIITTSAVIFITPRFKKYKLRTSLILAAVIVAPLPLHIVSFLAQTDQTTVPIVARLSNESQMRGSNDFRKLMATLAIEMVKAHPILGIGADNFGFEANRYRENYGASHPDDPNLAEAEDTIPERAHNEYLQIAAELGIVGVAIFAWFLFGVLLMGIHAFRRRSRLSLFPIAALISLAMFLASSLVSSYSFRLVQNGFIYFFVFAFAARPLFNDKFRRAPSATFNLTPLQAKFACTMAVGLSLLLTTYCTIRVTSVAYQTHAEFTPDLDEAVPLFETAMRLDSENPGARYFLGLRFVDAGRYADALPFLKESIRIGKAPSADFSYLASAQALAGDTTGAEQTFAQAVRLYPRSPFVLTRYAALLRQNGKDDESAKWLHRSTQIDQRQTNTWWTMITDSPQHAADHAVFDQNYLPLMELEPQTSMYAVRAEHKIRHPEEKIPF